MATVSRYPDDTLGKDGLLDDHCLRQLLWDVDIQCNGGLMTGYSGRVRGCEPPVFKMYILNGFDKLTESFYAKTLDFLTMK